MPVEDTPDYEGGWSCIPAWESETHHKKCVSYATRLFQCYYYYYSLLLLDGRHVVYGTASCSQSLRIKQTYRNFGMHLKI